LKHCQDENIERSEFDDQALLIVVANDVGGMDFLTSIINGQIAADRPEFMEAAFRRLQVIWPSLKGEILLKSAEILLDLSQVSPSTTSYNAAVSEASADLLRALPLSTEILLSYLSQLPTAAGMADSPPTTKRRRTSHGEVARASIQDPSLLANTIRKVTFVLQLVDSSNPSTHPEILKDLFNTLAELQHFKAQVASELAFLQRLCLGSLLEILKAHKSNRNLKLDRSAVRADLLVDCVQKTGSPQVQNDALLLIAALAETAPELVLHSVMPIFTFMGSSVLRQSDEYSAHVIDQTIREVIPPLIASLRKERGNIVTGASDLLLSFVAAYEHVPPHRRRGLLISLVETLGAEDFLFALLAMLVDKYGLNENIRAFLVELSGSFSVEVQLQSIVKYLDLVSDILRPKPTYSAVLLNTNEEDVKDPHGSALNELLLLPHLLSQRRLISQTAKILLRYGCCKSSRHLFYYVRKGSCFGRDSKHSQAITWCLWRCSGELTRVTFYERICQGSRRLN
jgi:U3 small nucleolar RNA-associated protein 10